MNGLRITVRIRLFWLPHVWLVFVGFRCASRGSMRTPRRSGAFSAGDWTPTVRPSSLPRYVTPAFQPETSHSQTMCAGGDDCEHVAENVSTFAKSVSIPPPSFAFNLSRISGCLRPERSMIASRYRYGFVRISRSRFQANRLCPNHSRACAPVPVSDTSGASRASSSLCVCLHCRRSCQRVSHAVIVMCMALRCSEPLLFVSVSVARDHP